MVSQSKDITVEYDCHIHVSLKDCHLMTLLAAFAVLLPQLLTEFLENILLGYARQVMAWPHKPFACDRCGNDQGFIWKTQHGRPTQLLTTFTWGALRQWQVQCSTCGHKCYLTRRLLGMERQERISKAVFRKLGLIGAPASYRVAAKIVSTFGGTIDKMTIGKAVQGGQRSLTKRRPKSSSSPSIRRRPPTARPMARASAFKGSANGVRNSKCSCNTRKAATSGWPGWGSARTTEGGAPCFGPAWRPSRRLPSSSWSPTGTPPFSTA